MTLTTWIMAAGQWLLLLLVAPLVTGFVKKTKALLQGRRGPRILQPYADLRKYLRKDQVVSEHASWLFTVTPYVVFGATVTATAFLPTIARQPLLSVTADLLLLVYLFALSRFFIALAGIDTGSTFGGQSASRDLFVAALAEPALLVTLLVTALPARSTNLATIADYVASHGLPITPAYFMMLVAFVILVVTETGRVPVDNPDTHLELTMIHEGTLLEYSGKPLALVMWSAWIKQAALFALLVQFALPWGPTTGAGFAGFAIAAILFVGKLLAIGVVMAVIETMNAKMRLFRVPRLLGAALALSVFAIMTDYLL